MRICQVPEKQGQKQTWCVPKEQMLRVQNWTLCGAKPANLVLCWAWSWQKNLSWVWYNQSNEEQSYETISSKTIHRMHITSGTINNRESHQFCLVWNLIANPMATCKNKKKSNCCSIAASLVRVNFNALQWQTLFFLSHRVRFPKRKRNRNNVF